MFKRPKLEAFSPASTRGATVNTLIENASALYQSRLARAQDSRTSRRILKRTLNRASSQEAGLKSSPLQVEGTFADVPCTRAR